MQSAREYSWQEHQLQLCNTRRATYKILNIFKRLNLLDECNRTAKVKWLKTGKTWNRNSRYKFLESQTLDESVKISSSDRNVHSDLTTDCSIQTTTTQNRNQRFVQSRRTKQQLINKRFKRNTSLFYSTENACLLVRETISLCSGCCSKTLAGLLGLWLAIVLYRSIYVSRAISCRKANK